MVESEFPPPPVEGIDWVSLGFDLMEVHGHIESTYSAKTQHWTEPRFIRDPYVRIHGMATGLNYGHQTSEGIKAFRGPGDKQISIFRPDRNALRMQHSAEVASLPSVPTDLFVQACRAVVALNAEFVPPHKSGAALYLRPQLYGCGGRLPLTPPEEHKFCVFAMPTGTIHGVNPLKAVILDEFDRTAPNGVGHAKLGGNYAPVMRWTNKARQEGYGLTLHLDSAKHEEIDEFSTAGFIGIWDDGTDGITVVVPDSKCIIESITSDSVMVLARSFGWKTEKRPVKYTELPSFSEVVAVGTAAGLLPVRSITRRTFLGHLPPGPKVTMDESSETVTYMPETQSLAGPLCLRLQTQLKGIQQGKVEDAFGWRFVVTGGDMDVEGRVADESHG